MTIKQLAADLVNRKDMDLVTEIDQYLDKLADNFAAISRELDASKKVSAAGVSYTIDQEELKQSPAPIDPKTIGVKPQDMKDLRRNYGLVHDLTEVLSALDTTEAKLRSAFPDEGVARKSLDEVARLRKSTNKKLEEAYAYLQNLAQGKAPKVFQEFVTQCNRIIEKSIVYLNSTANIYLHEVAGVLVFSHYLQLVDAIDEDGTTFERIFVVTSMTVEAPNKYFVSTLTQFEPPSGALLLAQVKNPKEVVRTLHHMLVMDSFSNSMGAFPVPLLLKPSDVRLAMFNEAQHISKVEVDDVTGNILFHLKPTVQDNELIGRISGALNLDLKNIMTRTRSRLRVAKKDWGDHWVLTYFMLKPDNAPQALAEDLEFLKERFQLKDDQVQRVLHIVNSSAVFVKTGHRSETARIKGDDEYTWLQYTGKPLNLSFRGTPVTLREGDRFGVRYSSNKKDKRLVLDAPGFGLTKVMTLTPDVEQRLYKSHTSASTVKAHTMAQLKERLWDQAWTNLMPELRGQKEMNESTLVDYLISYTNQSLREQVYGKPGNASNTQISIDAKQYIKRAPTPEWASVVTSGTVSFKFKGKSVKVNKPASVKARASDENENRKQPKPAKKHKDWTDGLEVIYEELRESDVFSPSELDTIGEMSEDEFLKCLSSTQTANVYETALSLVRFLKLAAGQPDRCWEHEGAPQHAVTKLLCSPSTTNDWGLIALRMVQNMGHQYGSGHVVHHGTKSMVTWDVRDVEDSRDVVVSILFGPGPGNLNEPIQVVIKTA